MAKGTIFVAGSSELEHARRWAVSALPENQVEPFLAWLMEMSQVEQETVAEWGYPAVIGRFKPV